MADCYGDNELSAFQVGEFRFLLQNYYVKEWAGNFMMHLMVKDADPWGRHIQDQKIPDKYPGIIEYSAFAVDGRAW